MNTSYVALLRGINVGTAKRIAMADLRAAVEAAGARDVRTLLNSGNVVFTSPRPLAGAALQKVIASRTGVDARVTVLTAAQFDVVVAENPLLTIADDPTRLLVHLPATPAALSALAPIAAQDWTPELLVNASHAAYSWSPDGLTAGHLFEQINKVCKDTTTARNWATISKLHEMLSKSI